MAHSTDAVFPSWSDTVFHDSFYENIRPLSPFQQNETVLSFMTRSPNQHHFEHGHNSPPMQQQQQQQQLQTSSELQLFENDELWPNTFETDEEQPSRTFNDPNNAPKIPIQNMKKIQMDYNTAQDDHHLQYTTTRTHDKKIDFKNGKQVHENEKNVGQKVQNFRTLPQANFPMHIDKAFGKSDANTMYNQKKIGQSPFQSQHMGDQDDHAPSGARQNELEHTRHAYGNTMHPNYSQDQHTRVTNQQMKSNNMIESVPQQIRSRSKSLSSQEARLLICPCCQWHFVPDSNDPSSIDQFYNHIGRCVLLNSASTLQPNMPENSSISSSSPVPSMHLQSQNSSSSGNTVIARQYYQPQHHGLVNITGNEVLNQPLKADLQPFNMVTDNSQVSASNTAFHEQNAEVPDQAQQHRHTRQRSHSAAVLLSHQTLPLPYQRNLEFPIERNNPSLFPSDIVRHEASCFSNFRRVSSSNSPTSPISSSANGSIDSFTSLPHENDLGGSTRNLTWPMSMPSGNDQHLIPEQHNTFPAAQLTAQSRGFPPVVARSLQSGPLQAKVIDYATAVNNTMLAQKAALVHHHQKGHAYRYQYQQQHHHQHQQQQLQQQWQQHQQRPQQMQPSQLQQTQNRGTSQLSFAQSAIATPLPASMLSPMEHLSLSAVPIPNPAPLKRAKSSNSSTDLISSVHHHPIIAHQQPPHSLVPFDAQYSQKNPINRSLSTGPGSYLSDLLPIQNASCQMSLDSQAGVRPFLQSYDNMASWHPGLESSPSTPDSSMTNNTNSSKRKQNGHW